MHPLLNIALKIVQFTSHALSREFDHMTTRPAENRAMIAKLRLAIEAKIAARIQASYPDHRVCFPSQHNPPTAETVWFIDILSGLNNYARAIPHFAICIAIQQQTTTVHCVIHDPMAHETFIASRNQFAQLNQFRIHVQTGKMESDTLLLAGNQVNRLPQTAIDRRQTGCNALMLAYVANGRFDGFAGNGLSFYELSAGSLLIKMAGGAYSDLSGGNAYTQQQELLATNPKLFKRWLQHIHHRSR